MCNFVPGECLAFGRLADMEPLVSDWSLPGVLDVVPLLSETAADDYRAAEPFMGYGFLHLTRIPEGLEVLAVSKLSAALARLIGSHEAVVELNAVIPFGAGEGRPGAFSPVVQRILSRLRSESSAALAGKDAPGRGVAVLDSGLDPGAFGLEIRRQGAAMPRPVTAYDLTEETAPGPVPSERIADRMSHGAVVCRMLDAGLDPSVPLTVGRVSRSRRDPVTALALARRYAHIVAREDPAVVNLSLAPLRDWLICPSCDADVPVDGLHSLMLPRVFALPPRTWTIMAAGNRGRPCDPDHYLAEAPRLIYATALDSSNRPAGYSNYLSGKTHRGLAAFGGDPAGDTSGQGILSAGSRLCGTSFAAPIVSVAVAIRNAVSEAADGGSLIDQTVFLTECRTLLDEIH